MRKWLNKFFSSGADQIAIDHLPNDPQLQNAMANA